MDERQKAGFVKSVGRAISARRAVAGLSQEDVAEALNISREAVSRIETGVAVPSIVRVYEMAEIFNCGIDELLKEASNREVDQAKHILELLEGVSDHQRQTLLSIVEQIVKGFASN